MSQTKVPRVTLLCPACHSPVVAAAAPVACSCGVELQFADGWLATPPAAVAACYACGSEALYLAKDFNKNLGVAIVAVGSLGFLWGALVGISCLVVLTILDRIVYYLRPLVTVCYACKAVYRDYPLNPSHKPYELTYDETFEGTGAPVRYRQRDA